MTGTTEGGKKTIEGGCGNIEKANPAAIEMYIRGVYFPVDRSDLIIHAKANKAPDYILDVLNQFEDRSYQSIVDVAKEVVNLE